MAKKVVIGVFTLGALGVAALFFIKMSEDAKQIEKLKASMCYPYHYDLKNPSVHSFGLDYHIKQWKNLEERYDLKPAKNIEEFCAPYEKDMNL